MAGDIPAIALYLNKNYATTLRFIKEITNWQVTEEDRTITALWKRTSEETFEKVDCARVSDSRRIEALHSITNLPLYTRLVTRLWRDDTAYWTDALQSTFQIKPELYKDDPLYRKVGDKQRCALLGELYERLICCHYALQEYKPSGVFNRYGIPSSMRNITQSTEDTWQAKSSECKRYPSTDGYDYTLFGERVKTWKKTVADGIEDEVFRTLIFESPQLTPKEWKDHLWHYLGVKVTEEAECSQLHDLFERMLHCEHDFRETSDPTAEVFHRYRLPKSMYRLIEYKDKPYLLTTLTSSWFKEISPAAKKWADQMLKGKLVERPTCITWCMDHRCEATTEFTLLGELKK